MGWRLTAANLLHGLPSLFSPRHESPCWLFEKQLHVLRARRGRLSAGKPNRSSRSYEVGGEISSIPFLDSATSINQPHPFLRDPKWISRKNVFMVIAVGPWQA